jgi:hypothetical protein
MNRAICAFSLFAVLMGMAPSIFVFVVVGGIEPVWVYFARWQIDGDRVWMVAAVFWTAAYLLLAWWSAGLLLRLTHDLQSHRRRLILSGVPLFLVLLSLFPIYSPVSHGQSSSTNIVDEFRNLEQQIRQKALGHSL